MKHIKNILLFTLLVSIALLAFILVFASYDGEIHTKSVSVLFIRNLPICLLIGAVDYLIIYRLHRWHSSFNVWTIVADVIVANIMFGLFSVVYVSIESYIWT